MTEFYADDSKLSYPEADRIVEQYIDAKAGEKRRTTSRDVLKWTEVPDTMHNKKRAHDALSRVCEDLDTNWAGRTVFRLPRGDQQ